MKWEKGYDPFDDSPRYTFEGRDPSNTLEDIQVVIYQEKEPEYMGGRKRAFYYGVVRHNPTETQDIVGRCRTLKSCKDLTMNLYEQYVDKFEK